MLKSEDYQESLFKFGFVSNISFPIINRKHQFFEFEGFIFPLSILHSTAIWLAGILYVL